MAHYRGFVVNDFMGQFFLGRRFLGKQTSTLRAKGYLLNPPIDIKYGSMGADPSNSSKSRKAFHVHVRQLRSRYNRNG